MKTIRYGVVGLGHRGRAMAELGAKFPCARLVAACDLNEKNWTEKQWLSERALAEAFPEARFYQSYEAMLAEAALDLVIVETGADIHAEFCIRALERGINVLTDIPVVASLEEAERLWESARRSKAMISVGANPNESKFAVLLEEFYRDGLLGEPYCMEGEYIHWSLPKSEERIHLHENGDWRRLLCPIRYCTHSLGPLLKILKEELRYVSCFGTGAHTEESGKDDMQCAQFCTEGGVVVRLMRNGRCRAKIGQHNYRVFGTEGYMERIERNKTPVIRYNSTKEADNAVREIGGEFMPPAYADNPDACGHGGMDYAMLDHVFCALLEGKAAPISLKEGLAMTLPGIYAEESRKRNGQVLTMHYPWEKDWTTEIP